jgi:probable addiction module antidote protein
LQTSRAGSSIPNPVSTASAKARGMAEVAKAPGLGRESLYKTLAPGAKPRF